MLFCVHGSLRTLKTKQSIRMASRCEVRSANGCFQVIGTGERTAAYGQAQPGSVSKYSSIMSHRWASAATAE